VSVKIPCVYLLAMPYSLLTYLFTYLLTYLFTYLLTPWSRVLENLTGLQLVKKFPAFYGTRRFITALTSARHLSMPYFYLSVLFILLISSLF